MGKNMKHLRAMSTRTVFIQYSQRSKEIARALAKRVFLYFYYYIISRFYFLLNHGIAYIVRTFPLLLLLPSRARKKY